MNAKFERQKSAEPDENAHVALYFFPMHFTQVCKVEKVYHDRAEPGYI